MLGKLKSMIDALTRDILNYYPAKGLMLQFEGAGASDPTININYNVTSITRTSVGLYNITPTQATFYGFDLFAVATHSIGFIIAPSITSELFSVELTPGGGGTFNIQVSELTVGVGNKLEVNPYDLLAGDTVDVNVFLNIGTRLPPE